MSFKAHALSAFARSSAPARKKNKKKQKKKKKKGKEQTLLKTVFPNIWRKYSSLIKSNPHPLLRNHPGSATWKECSIEIPIYTSYIHLLMWIANVMKNSVDPNSNNLVCFSTHIPLRKRASKRPQMTLTHLRFMDPEQMPSYAASDRGQHH